MLSIATQTWALTRSASTDAAKCVISGRVDRETSMLGLPVALMAGPPVASTASVVPFIFSHLEYNLARRLADLEILAPAAAGWVAEASVFGSALALALALVLGFGLVTGMPMASCAWLFQQLLP